MNRNVKISFHWMRLRWLTKQKQRSELKIIKFKCKRHFFFFSFAVILFSSFMLQKAFIVVWNGKCSNKIKINVKRMLYVTRIVTLKRFSHIFFFYSFHSMILQFDKNREEENCVAPFIHSLCFVSRRQWKYSELHLWINEWSKMK